MTVTQHGAPGPQHGPPPSAPAPGGPPAPPTGPPPGYDWRYAQPPVPTRRSKGLPIATAAAIVLATAALVVGIINLVRPAHTAAPTAPTAVPTAGTPTPGQDTTAADHAFCTAIAPLMTESDRISKAYSNLGPAGSPAWNAGLPNFISETKEWVGHIQPIVDSNTTADPFLQRSLQRFIDDQRFLVADLGAGPFQPYDDAIWQDSLAAYSGPLSICYGLGVKW
jgi:hypothetical protein